jgi:hypothetical protein
MAKIRQRVYWLQLKTCFSDMFWLVSMNVTAEIENEYFPIMNFLPVMKGFPKIFNIAAYIYIICSFDIEHERNMGFKSYGIKR